MDADGGNPKRLTTGIAYNGWPAWSPDGSKIAFVSTRDDNYEIYVMDPNGDNQTRLTFANTSRDQSPTWSPDGSQIAFMSDRSGVYEIYVMDSSGENPINITVQPYALDGWPDWQPGPPAILTSLPAEAIVTIPLIAATSTTPPISSTTSITLVTTVPVDTTAAPVTSDVCEPEAPVLLQPMDESTVDETKPVLEWGYRQQPCVISAQTLELAGDEEFAGETLRIEVRSEVGTWTPESNLEDCSTYYWRVEAIDGGSASFSEVFSFETDFLKRSGAAVCQ